MAKRKFVHFVPRPKPKKRKRRHKKDLNKNEKRMKKNLGTKVKADEKRYNNRWIAKNHISKR